MLYLAFEELVEPAKLKQTCRFPHEVSGLNCVDLVKHGQVVEREFLEEGAEEVVGDIGLA